MKDRIFLHPGLGPGARYYLESSGTLEDLLRSDTVLIEGALLYFYDYDGTEVAEDDNLLFEGTVHYDKDRNQWFAIIDWSSFTHESDLEQH